MLGDNPIGRARRAAVAKMCAESGSTLRLARESRSLATTMCAPSTTAATAVEPAVERVGPEDDASVERKAPRASPPSSSPARASPTRVWYSPPLSLAASRASARCAEEVAVDGDARKRRRLGARVPGPVFALIVAVEDDPAAVVAAETRADALRAAAPVGTNLRLVLVARDGAVASVAGKGTGTGAGTGTGTNGDGRGAQLRVVAVDVEGDWWAIAGVDGGTPPDVLARPDGHVAWVGGARPRDGDGDGDNGGGGGGGDGAAEALREALGWSRGSQNARGGSSR